MTRPAHTGQRAGGGAGTRRWWPLRWALVVIGINGLVMAALGVFSYPLAALVSDLGFFGLVVIFLGVALAVTLYALIENGRQRGLPSTLVLATLVVTATVGLLLVDLKVWYPRALYQVERDHFARVVELAEAGEPFSVPRGLDGRIARVDRSPRGVEIFLPMAAIERGQVYGYGYAHIPGGTRGTWLRTAPGQCARWPLAEGWWWTTSCGRPPAS